MSDTPDVTITTEHPAADVVLTPEALAFVAGLQRRFGARRAELLQARADRQARFDAGERPDFPEETREIREKDWQVPEAPKPLADRRVEITGPVQRKMMINAFNSGAKVFMADFEDANSPTWDNIVAGQLNLMEAVRGTLAVEATEEGGKAYKLNDQVATLVVRPRGWHLPERHVLVDGEPISASLFDAGLYLFHNGRATLEHGFGPYFYLPKLESYHEARLWEEVLSAAEEELGLEHGSVRVTVLIETITAAFEMDEILWELRDHITGLNAGRWDYIFSVAKCFAKDPAFVLPDRKSVTMTVPFMRAYTERLVKVCHWRGAHAIGGMAAFIPNRRKPDVTEAALAKVAEDKQREAGDGFDGTWVAHPDLVDTAMEQFDAVLGEAPNQLERQRDEVHVGAGRLLDVSCERDGITADGLHTNISVGLRYLTSWLNGTGAAAIDDLMEDAATAEISRAQVWQWVHHECKMADGRRVTPELVREGLDTEQAAIVEAGYDADTVAKARQVFEAVALADDFPAFLTLPAYELLP